MENEAIENLKPDIVVFKLKASPSSNNRVFHLAAIMKEVYWVEFLSSLLIEYIIRHVLPSSKYHKVSPYTLAQLEKYSCKGQEVYS